MRLLLVAQQLRRAAPGGIGTYIRGLLDGLGRVDDMEGVDDVDVTLLASERVPGPLLTRAWDLGLLAAPDGFDIVHAPSLAFPRSRQAPTVVAVHDLAWRHVPESFPPRGRRWHEAALQRAVRRGAVFVTPTEGTAAELGGTARVLTPMYGCDHLPPADPDATAALLRRLGVDGPYLLAVGTLEPRKNLARLMTAFTRARPRLPDPWPLVVVGPQGWGEQVTPVPGVVAAGAVTPSVLAGLYAGARCLAYVPLYEGWGLPAVEAMAAATPVVASPLPSAGSAALEVDPTDVEAIAEGLVAASGDDRRRAELVTAGLMHTRDRTWEAAARAHVEVWRSVTS